MMTFYVLVFIFSHRQPPAPPPPVNTQKTKSQSVMRLCDLSWRVAGILVKCRRRIWPIWIRTQTANEQKRHNCIRFAECVMRLLPPGPLGANSHTCFTRIWTRTRTRTHVHTHTHNCLLANTPNKHTHIRVCIQLQKILTTMCGDTWYLMCS